MSDTQISRIIAKFGCAHTLRKVTAAPGANAWTAGAGVDAFVACGAFARRQTPAATEGNSAAAQSEIIVDAATCPATPTIGDAIAAGVHVTSATGEWVTVAHVDVRTVAGKPALYVLTVRS
jgi:hypothetical protein